MTTSEEETTLGNMPAVRPEASIEPSRTLRIARGCTEPGCGAVYYVAQVTDVADCPACTSARDAWSLSA
jgi:hypothetical protein